MNDIRDESPCRNTLRAELMDVLKDHRCSEPRPFIDAILDVVEPVLFIHLDERRSNMLDAVLDALDIELVARSYSWYIADHPADYALVDSIFDALDS